MIGPTQSQIDALRWLSKHNGDGVFDRHQVLLAAGEKAPVRRGTWNRLSALGLVEIYAERRRCRLTDKGWEASQ